jgi:hypothetical protein
MGLTFFVAAGPRSKTLAAGVTSTILSQHGQKTRTKIPPFPPKLVDSKTAKKIGGCFGKIFGK